MTRSSFKSVPVPDHILTPTQAQERAADPDYSVWVGASAGSVATCASDAVS